MDNGSMKSMHSMALITFLRDVLLLLTTIRESDPHACPKSNLERSQ